MLVRSKEKGEKTHKRLALPAFLAVSPFLEFEPRRAGSTSADRFLRTGNLAEKAPPADQLNRSQPHPSSTRSPRRTSGSTHLPETSRRTTEAVSNAHLAAARRTER
ncbi:hypothetical protein ACJRO7_019750 [Eucalyptus globulus]|uniref:Uncharacterized protein n=1 Tax=Eucalyptus globulus TaxID=34317 RepID=A0ABD3KR31_EUCGL